MEAPLVGIRFAAVGQGRVLDQSVALLELLGADVVRVPQLAGPVHANRVGELDVTAALDADGRLGEPPFPVLRLAADPDPRAAWAASGAAALTGDGDGPAWSAPGLLVERVLGAGAVVQLLAACRGVALDLDPLALLGERAAIAGFGRRGATAVGGMCELIEATDGWIACNLARREDVDALPALVDGEADAGDWPATRAAIGRRTRAQLLERAALLGLPIAAWPGPDGLTVPSPLRIDGRVPRAGVRAGHLQPADDVGEHPLVVDLSSLWAGPLAGSLLHASGARVLKIEGARRPDGARRGPSEFFDLLNAGKEMVALDFARDEDRALLAWLVESADVVIEASRPRVMASLGIDPVRVARDARTTWISITGHGREGEDAARVAFGDDAAVAAGCTVGDPPRFVADAIADPIAGLYAAAVGLAALIGRRGQLVDLSLRDAAAYARGAGGPRGEPYHREVAAPLARIATGSARALGADTEAVRAEFGYGRRS